MKIGGSCHRRVVRKIVEIVWKIAGILMKRRAFLCKEDSERRLIEGSQEDMESGTKMYTEDMQNDGCDSLWKRLRPRRQEI